MDADETLDRDNALARVRDAVWHMQSVDETYVLLDAIEQALHDADVTFSACGVNVVELTSGEPKALFYDREKKEWRDGEPNQGSENVLLFWQGGETVYRSDLEREDLYGETPHFDEYFTARIRSVVDVPFSRGTLAVNSTHANGFSSETIAFIEQLARILEEGFRRLQDLENLQRSEARYRQLIEQSPSPVVVYADGDLLFLNPAAVHTLGGQSAEQFVGHPLMDLIHPNQRRRILRRMSAIDPAQEHHPTLIEKFVRLDGEEIDIEISSHPIDYMGRAAVQVTFRDITAQQRAERMLKVNLALQRVRNEVLRMEGEADWHRIAASIYAELRQLVSFHQCGFMLVDLANDSFDAFLITEDHEERRPNKGIPSSLRQVVEDGEILYRRNRDEIARFGDKVGADGGCIVDVPFLGGTLALNHTRENAFSERDIDTLAQFAQVLSEAYRRVEDLRRVEQQQQQLNQRQKMEAIGELAGGLAHDFNNLLTAILTTCDIMLLDRAEDSPGRDEIDLIKRAGEQAAALTRQLLAFSRRQVVQSQVIDLNDVLSKSHPMLRRLIGEHIELSTVLDSKQCLAELDFNQVEQIVMNLAINARDAMPTGGVLSISTQRVEVGPERAEVPAGSYALLRVSDEGGGIEDDIIGRIFEPFFTTKDSSSGTGMGLSIVYGAVEQSNGHICVSSALGEGTTFEIYFPLVESAHHIAAAERQQEQITGGSETVLLVEDNDLVRTATYRVLSSTGYNVLLAKNAEEALQLIEKQREAVDLVLSDIVMPGMSGDKLAGHLQQQNPQQRVLLMSGYTDDGRVYDYPFLAKPFVPEELLKKVREVLES